jgi:hypothetical protein
MAEQELKNHYSIKFLRLILNISSVHALTLLSSVCMHSSYPAQCACTHPTQLSVYALTPTQLSVHALILPSSVCMHSPIISFSTHALCIHLAINIYYLVRMHSPHCI